MNYTAGILAFLLFYVPLFFVYRKFVRDNERTDENYQTQLRKIYDRK